MKGRAVVLLFKTMGLKVKKALANVPILGKGIDVDQVNEDLRKVKDELIAIAKEKKASILMATHDMHIVKLFPSRTLLVENGVVMEKEI